MIIVVLVLLAYDPIHPLDTLLLILLLQMQRTCIAAYVVHRVLEFSSNPSYGENGSKMFLASVRF